MVQSIASGCAATGAAGGAVAAVPVLPLSPRCASTPRPGRSRAWGRGAELRLRGWDASGNGPAAGRLGERLLWCLFLPAGSAAGAFPARGVRCSLARRGGRGAGRAAGATPGPRCGLAAVAGMLGQTAVRPCTGTPNEESRACPTLAKTCR